MLKMKRKRSPEVTPSGIQNMDLDPRIEEGKQENRKALKEELHRKLRIIRSPRTSGMNRGPFPNGTFERLKRNDVLLNVLEYLTDPADVTDTYFACKTFAEILEERRMLIMLPKVLNLFKKKVDEAFEIKGREVGKACYRNWNTICLNARKVCKAWKAIVDSHSDTAREDWLLTTDWTELHNPRANLYTFGGDKSVDQATSLLIGRDLPVSHIRDIFLIVGDHISEPYYRKLLEFFKTYGSSVRFINFHYEGSGSGNIASRLCCEMLKHMENLKMLSIMFNPEDEIPEMEEAFQDHQQRLNDCPLRLPALKSLEHFFCYDWEPNESLVSQILGKCANLKSVDLFRTEPTDQETTEALMRLNLERFEGLATIITSNQFTWPLKHLEIVPGNENELSASAIFPAINRFRETLQHLHLWTVVEMDTNATSLRLELPHLKSIFIRVIRYGTLGFDDILHLNSLEEIIVETPKSVEYEDENAVVKVKTYFDKAEMHKSNVWQCFPNLRRFKNRFGCTYCRPNTPT